MIARIKKPALFFGERVSLTGVLRCFGRFAHLEILLDTGTAVWFGEFDWVSKIDARVEPVHPCSERFAVYRIRPPVRCRCDYGCSRWNVVDLLGSLPKRLVRIRRRPDFYVPLERLARSAIVHKRPVKSNIACRDRLRRIDTNR